eukprot:gene20875-25033_t
MHMKIEFKYSSLARVQTASLTTGGSTALSFQIRSVTSKNIHREFSALVAAFLLMPSEDTQLVAVGVAWNLLLEFQEPSEATADTLLSVEYLTKRGEKRILHRDSGELDCGYRWSPFQDMPDLAAITAATFELHRNADAGARVRQLME